MSKEKANDVKALLDNMINKEIPAMMDAIMKDAKMTADIKAARVGLANTSLHHLRMLRGAMEQ